MLTKPYRGRGRCPVCDVLVEGDEVVLATFMANHGRCAERVNDRIRQRQGRPAGRSSLALVLLGVLVAAGLWLARRAWS